MGVATSLQTLGFRSSFFYSRGATGGFESAQSHSAFFLVEDLKIDYDV